MHCKHLLHYRQGKPAWSVASCSARNTPYVPSLIELERYCQSSRHAICPAYLFSCVPGRPARESPVAAGVVGM